MLSLYPESVSGIRSLSSPAETVTATQVRLISISNTLSRLLSGPLADFISPLTSDGSPPRRYGISRVMLLSGVSLLLIGTFVYLELFIRSPDDLRILRCVALVLSCSHFAQWLIQYWNWRCLRYHIHNSVRQFFLSLPCITHCSHPDLDPALYPPSGEARTSGVTLVY